MDFPDLTRLALSYGASLLAYHGRRGPHPFSAAFAVTNRCNLRCVYCNTPYLDPRDLPLAQVELLFDRLRSLGVRRLGLVGGEPLVRRDIGALVARARARRFTVTLNSNLLLYPQKRDVFEGVDLVFTSLDGDAETHRRNRGARSYDGVLEAIEELVGRGKPVVAIAVVREGSLEQAEVLLRQAEALGFEVHFQPQCTETEIVRGGIPDAVTSEELRKFWSALLEQKRAGRPIASSPRYLAEQARWRDFRVSAFLDPSQRCAAGRGFLYVDPQGNAYPCAFTKGKAEPVNLLEEDWRRAFPGTTPCTTCNVGPMLEFNLLFRHPLAGGVEALRRLA